MSHSPIHFKISQLRHQSMVRTTEAIMVLFGSIVAIAVLPSLLLRYFYDTSTLLEQPKLLEYIPVAAFVIAGLYFFNALISNMRNERQVRQLMNEMEMMGDDCCGGACCSDHDTAAAGDEDWDEDLKELEDLLAEVEKEEKTGKKSTAKSSVKKAPVKAAKKSSKK